MTQIQTCDGNQARALLEELADLYVRIYAEPPYNSAPKFSRARFLDRTRVQTRSAGFTLITARQGGQLIGFAFGFTMAPGSWWANASPPPTHILDASKLAVIEFIVDKPRRGQGIGRALIEALLADRPEPYATLAAVIGSDAYDRYLRSGWTKVGEFRVEPPFSDAFALHIQDHYVPSETPLGRDGPSGSPADDSR